MPVDDEVRAVSAAFDAALLRNDADAIGQFMTDDWVYVGPSGATPRSDILGWIGTGKLAHHTMTVVGDERLARVGDAVVYTARKASTGSWDATPYTAEEWITELYVQANGRWQCAFSQKTDATSEEE